MEAWVVNSVVTLVSVVGGLRVAMNGLHKSQERIEKKLEVVDSKLDNHGNRLTKLETKWEDHAKT